MSLHIIILAAGQGKRMRSKTPKVLHPVGGMPMLERVIKTACKLSPDRIHAVYGHGGEQIRDVFKTWDLNWVYQSEQLGTGHAVLQVLSHLPETGEVLILSGDVPLIHVQTLRQLVDSTHQHHTMTLLTAMLDNPFGLGRIVRNEQNQIEAIIEEKDATAAQKAIREIYSGIGCMPIADLKRWLPRLNNNNAQKEYYLTEIISMARQEVLPVESVVTQAPGEILGVNDRTQLHELERIHQYQIASDLMRAGVTLADAKRIDVRGELHCDEDVFIDVNCIFIGRVTIASGCHIGPNCMIQDTQIDAHTRILANSVIEGSQIGRDCQIGPFARLRSGTVLSDNCRIGNFVETKKATFGAASKASHLSYIGDATIGSDVNIGAGTITCNYDGVNKHQTVIEDGAFIGSDTQLVAPVTVGAYATLGAGTTLRKDAPPGALTLTVSSQKTLASWQRPLSKPAL